VIDGVACAILAGGQASRMHGQAKSFLVVDGRRIIDRQLDVLRQLFGEIFVVASDPAAYAPLGLRVVADERPGEGPLMGILTAITRAAAPRVVCVACDMPFLSAAALARLADPSEPADVVVPVVAGRAEPLFARWSRACAPALRARLAAGDRAVHHALADLDVRRLDEAELRAIDPRLRFLANCNTPDDLWRAGRG
jgi:molybdopterin-guanine dinucleotide biosynthesis protein A